MIVNFEIIDNYALNYKGKHLDLHNNFDFINFEYKVETQTLILRWVKSAGGWVKDDDPPSLVLIHKRVGYLYILPRDPEMPFTEDTCLMDLTYFASSHRDINDSVGGGKLPNAGDDILYFFQSGQVVRINCDEVELVIG
jgi:hypothetical protein